MGFGNDNTTGAGRLFVLDAQTLDDVASVELPARVPDRLSRELGPLRRVGKTARSV